MGYHCSRANNRIAAYRDARQDNRASTKKRVVSNAYVTTQGHTRTNECVHADLAIMVDARSSIDNNVFPNIDPALHN